MLPSAATYKTFAQPASHYNIIWYICCLEYAGTTEPSGTVYPPGMNVSYAINSNTTLTLAMAVKTDTYIDKIHFTVIVYDAV